ncbi:hypothetical protein AB0C93_17090 [Streptomyces sp. NPDC048518]|uniref:hypothetical protein n=1 Tax=Streptomyces sp. NPDC048518 TaxID=3155029 RepID=UPI0033CB1D49
MRSRTCTRAAVLLVALLAVQGGASAVADGGKPPAPRPAPQPAAANPLAPFEKGAAAFVGMAAPFVDAASDAMFPRR